MRVVAILSLLVTLVGTSAFAYDPYPFQRSDGLWGYVDDDHCWVIEPQFDSAGSFSEGLATVRVGTKWGFISTSSAAVIMPEFDNAGSFHEGIAAVEIGKKWGAVDVSGNLVIEPLYGGGFIFSEGLAAVYFENGMMGYINTRGNVEIPPQFTFAFEFENGKAWVALWNADKASSISGLIDRSGSIVSIDRKSVDGHLDWKSANDQIEKRETLYGLKSNSTEGLSAVVNAEGKWGFVDTENKLVIDQAFDGADEFRSGRAKVRVGYEDYVIDRTGRVLLDPTCDHTR
jgi:hypothetical protein